MKRLNKVAVMLAVTMAGSAFAAGSPAANDNWTGTDEGLVWKNGSDELCWQNSGWTEGTAATQCGRAVAQAPAPVAPPPVSAPIPEPAPAPQVTSEKVTFSADTFFDFDKAVLKSEGKAALDDLVAQLSGVNVETIVAVGHTDSVGSEKYNQRLSERRAQAVRDYLVSRGVSDVYVEGKGETQPVADNKTKAGRAQNRRVEIEVTGSKTVTR